MQLLRFIKVLALPIALIICSLLCANLLSAMVQYTYNPSPSEAIGYYLLYSSEIEVGNIYQICLSNKKEDYINIMINLGLPKKGNCKNGNTSLLKTVVAGPGDQVNITESGVIINNKLLKLSNSIALYNGIELHPKLPGMSFKLESNEFWLYGQGTTSYDSRYFGIVTKDEIINKAILIIPINFNWLNKEHLNVRR